VAVVAFWVGSSASDSLSVRKARKRAIVSRASCQPEEAAKDATVIVTVSQTATR
jgi:hypothetical protein